MTSFGPSYITLDDLYIAYRKAKREAYSDSNCAHGAKFAAFEGNLVANLKALHDQLCDNTPVWFKHSNRLGRVALIAKKVEACKERTDSIHFSSCNPTEFWKRQHSTNEKKAVAEFRPVIDATVEFMVISALWIIKVGHKYDAKLDPRFAVGNRLRRRRRSHLKSDSGEIGDLNEQCHSLFEYYPVAYANWRKRGLTTMRRELEEGHKIVAITMDLQKFYHRVDAEFLLRKNFLAKLDLELSTDEHLFTRQILKAIATWNKASGFAVGLPVGLPASGLIANVFLKELDDRITGYLSPVYYGRYVDDIFLVCRVTQDFSSGSEVLEWIVNRLNSKTKGSTITIAYHKGSDKDEPYISLSTRYSQKHPHRFLGTKQKIFLLEGKHGLDLIAPIEDQIREQSSEYRSLPDVPDGEAEMVSSTLLVTPDESLDADALRKADSVTLRRAGIAILLRDIEQHAKDLSPQSWISLRKHFYDLISRHVVTPSGFFDYPRYFSRMLGLMVCCRDFDLAKEFVAQVAEVKNLINLTCKSEEHADFKQSLNRCCDNLATKMCESAIQAFTLDHPASLVIEVLDYLKLTLSNDLDVPSSIDELVLRSNRLLTCDWSRLPYYQHWISAEPSKNTMEEGTRISISKNPIALPLHALEEFVESAKLPKAVWQAVMFPTRPIPVSKITELAPDLLKQYKSFRKVVMGLRGIWLPKVAKIQLCPSSQTGTPTKIIVPKKPKVKSNERAKKRLLVAVTNYQTSDEEWKASVDNTPDLSLERYRRLNGLINSLIQQDVTPTYVLLPECSVPRRGAPYLSSKLAQNKISLIAGLEYRHTKDDIVNEALISLVSDFPGFPIEISLIQPKSAPAWHENQLVEAQIGKSVQSRTDACTVYVHGDFCFGVLICSDLTDINNRRQFRGEIDCLFVPEWNSDLESFSALVESATLDLHAFVVQANNRQFGDGRIRGPFKKHYRRDIVRVRGGIHDYGVVGEIDYGSLREYQSNYSPSLGEEEQFKPFPIGFVISERRRVRRGIANP